MILLLIILYLSPSFIHAASPSLLDSNSTVSDLSSSTQLPSPHQQRSIRDILWSCLATIFACTWVSVHPNVPPRNEKWWMASLRRLELMVWAILAPELMVSWAMRQWLGARRLAKKYRDKGWTKTHGYFLQMGGFALFKGGDFQGLLYEESVQGLPGDRDINTLPAGKFPMTTEEEIQDRSKGDGLSKALALSQTLWFLTQCTARHMQGLYITELELATGAFVVLNGVMYFLWWNKPLAVRCPVPIQLLAYTPGEQPPNYATSETKMIRPTIYPSAMLYGIFYRLAEIGNWRGSKGYPRCTFYASIKGGEDLVALKWASVAAIVFGGIHCAGCVFTFPSHAELVIWCISSVVTTTIPFLPLAVVSFDGWGPVLKVIFCFLTFFSFPFYMIARVLLLVEAFTTLRGLPPGAYEVVRWATFIPHIRV